MFKPQTKSPYNQHSALALFIYNKQVKSPLYHKANTKLARVLSSPVVPFSLFVGHLYLIALFLRNPFQKVELN